MVPSAFPPAVAPILDRGMLIPALALNIAGRALDAKVFYQDQFEQACHAAWMEAFPVTCKTITPGQGGCGYVEAVDDGFEARKAQFEALKEQLRTEPRGTWALVRRAWPHDPSRFSWSVAMSVGGGEVTSPDLSGIVGQPTFDELVRRMVGYEIYTARHFETKRRDEITSLAKLRERAWAPGVALRDVRTSGGKYSSGTITQLSGPYVTIELKRRGSPRRWTWTGLAQAVIAERASPARRAQSDLGLVEAAA